MPSLLTLISDLEYHGRSRQASQLAAGLPRDKFASRCFSLAGPGPFADPMRDAGVDVLGRRPRGPVSLENFLALRKLLKGSPPDVVHVWGLDCLRALGWVRLIKRSEMPPLIVSLDGSEPGRKAMDRLDRRLVDWPRAYVVRFDSDRDRFAAAGIPAGKIEVIPPGVSPPKGGEGNVRQDLGFRPADCLFMSVGHFNSSRRFQEALWCIDLIHGIDPAAKAVLIGDGPSRERIARRYYFTKNPDGGVVFLGARPDAAALLTQADAVIVGHKGGGGTYAVLEAMAAGKPVITATHPHVRQLVRDGETGFLAEPGQIPVYSHYAMRMVRDPDLREKIGAAARADVLARFPVERMVDAYADLYERVASRLP